MSYTEHKKSAMQMRGAKTKMDEKSNGIPHGYMTVGQLAKKMDVTVRTIQYYDKRGILPPSSVSEGGRRLYTDKDFVKLHQIQSLKYLGFSLEQIKQVLPTMSNPEEVSSILVKQIKQLRDKISSLTDSLEALEAFAQEVTTMEKVDWAAYADIIMLLQSNSELYWTRKHFSEKVTTQVANLYEAEIGELVQEQNLLLEEAEQLHLAGVAPDSTQGQRFAQRFWQVVMQIVGDNTHLLNEFADIATKYGDKKWKAKQSFIEKALDFYLSNNQEQVERGEI